MRFAFDRFIGDPGKGQKSQRRDRKGGERADLRTGPLYPGADKGMVFEDFDLRKLYLSASIVSAPPI